MLETGSTTLNSHKFTGYEKDQSTGLDYAEARMYAGSRGRFTTPDPQWLSAASARRPQTLNRYSYVNNDPVNFVDRTGLGDCGFLICDSITVNGSTNDDPNTVPGVVSSIGTGTGLDHDQVEEDSSGGAGGNQSEATKEWLKAFVKGLKREAALNKARSALQNPDCQEAILSGGYPDPLGLLNFLADNGQFTEKDPGNQWPAGGQPTSTPAYTNGIGENASISLRTGYDANGNYRSSFFESQNYGLPLGVSLDSDTQRAIIFLHELSHATGRYTHPENVRDGILPPHEEVIGNRELTNKIYEKCFKEK